MRRLAALLGLTALLLLPAGAAHADFDPWSMSGEEMQEAGFGKVADGRYCKDLNEVSEEEFQTFLDTVEKSDEEAAERYESTLSPEGNMTGENLCFEINSGEEAVCVATVFDATSTCFDRETGERDRTTALETRDPIESIGSSAADTLAESINSGLIYAMYWLLTRWLVSEAFHVDLATNGAQMFYPHMLWIGGVIAFSLLVWQALKMMWSRKPEVLMTTVKGVMWFAVWTVCGVMLLGFAIKAADTLTEGFITYGFDSAYGQSWKQDQEQCQAPEDVADDVDEAVSPEDSEAQNQLLKCATQSVDFGDYNNASGTIVFGIIGLIMMLIQMALLFVREAAIPLIALIIPIAASGQIGGAATRKWLPGLISLALTIVLYKPMVALVMGVGLTEAVLPGSELDFMRGLLTMCLGVIAPGMMLKAFGPLVNNMVEQGASLGSAMNNVMMVQQITSHYSQRAEQRAQQRAAEQARRTAERQAIGKTAEAAAGVGTGGVGLLLSKSGDAAEKAAKVATSDGTRATTAAPAGEAGGKGEAEAKAKGPETGPGPGGSGTEPAGGHPHPGAPGATEPNAGPSGGVSFREFPTPPQPPPAPPEPAEPPGPAAPADRPAPPPGPEHYKPIPPTPHARRPGADPDEARFGETDEGGHR
ncbi:cell envelope integrity protein TolA [Nocardiopsis halophila]|uniref:cell envelope integrity protein TolA n=1 Tax=Nocardiopsis halophila TaxID=141692 RepID=UPI0003721E71|nr:cell envelope integrity protein TolA [Nocardiopsis halophila]